jgi:hypothetical protein
MGTGPGGCMYACECAQGEDCMAGDCVDADPPVWCCDNPGCPEGEPCVTFKGDPLLCP